MNQGQLGFITMVFVWMGAWLSISKPLSPFEYASTSLSTEVFDIRNISDLTMSCLKEVTLIDLSFLKDTVLRTGAGFTAHALNMTAKWSWDTLPVRPLIPGSMTLISDTIQLLFRVITTSKMWPRTWVASFTCCCISHDWRRLLNVDASRFEELSRCLSIFYANP